MSKKSKSQRRSGEPVTFRDRQGNLFFQPGELRRIHNEEVPVYDPVACLRDEMYNLQAWHNPMKQKRIFKSDIYADISTGTKLPAGLAMETERRPGCSRREKEKWYGDTKKNGKGGKYVMGSYEDDIEDWERLQENLDHLRRVQQEKKARAKFQHSIQEEQAERVDMVAAEEAKNWQAAPARRREAGKESSKSMKMGKSTKNRNTTQCEEPSDRELRSALNTLRIASSSTPNFEKKLSKMGLSVNENFKNQHQNQQRNYRQVSDSDSETSTSSSECSDDEDTSYRSSGRAMSRF